MNRGSNLERGPNITAPNSFSWLAVKKRAVVRAFGRKTIFYCLTLQFKESCVCGYHPRRTVFLGGRVTESTGTRTRCTLPQSRRN